MAGRLDDQHVLVTGGSRGIGAAIVEKALAEGARVSIIDIEEAAGKAFVASLNADDRLYFARGDIRVADEIKAFHAAAVAKLGPVTGLVNNAGRNSNADPVTMTEARRVLGRPQVGLALRPRSAAGDDRRQARRHRQHRLGACRPHLSLAISPMRQRRPALSA
jgi:NAD(P)-dependent dehydrogenase (short-subunit alcohol dehydrogenase family)